MIIANKENISDIASKNEANVTKQDSKYIESDVRIVEIDGHIFRVKKIFATEGRTILEGVVSMLLDRMERQEKVGQV